MPDIILPYEPIVIIDTTDLPRDEWLAYRKTGIGGSDVAAILGISPFGTARDIYYDKLSIASFYDDEANKYQKKIGTLLEDVVAEMFAEVTGYRVFKIRKMFRSREHSFMLADVDFLSNCQMEVLPFWNVKRPVRTLQRNGGMATNQPFPSTISSRADTICRSCTSTRCSTPACMGTARTI